MHRLNLDIPDELRAKLEARAVAAGHSSLQHYVLGLLRDEVDAADHDAPEHLKIRSRQRLNALVEQGLQSPLVEPTAAEWEEKKRQLMEQHKAAS